MPRTATKKKASKKKANKKKAAARPASRHRYTAATADKYELYQKAVQSPETDVDFLSETYEKLVGRPPRHLREDFCGTALICCEWVTRGEDRTAEGYDLDPEPIEWGKQHNRAKVRKLGAEDRITIYQEDARAPGRKAPDVRVAQNFSYWIFHERAELLEYFRIARESLAEDGIFVIDLYGGTEGTVEMEEERKIEGGFTYVWDQDEYFPGTAEFFCKIHFRFRDGSELRNAFEYAWRRWGMAELKDLLREAGFSDVQSYFEGDDEDDPEEGNGVFEPDPRGENCESWISYLVSRK
jgi:SAM-dependent methyltransferase